MSSVDLLIGTQGPLIRDKIALMLETYEAILHDNQLEWESESPVQIPAGQRVRVQVKLLEEIDSPSELERRRRMIEALESIASRGNLAGIDPVEWQREQRVDRPLPGRGE